MKKKTKEKNNKLNDELKYTLYFVGGALVLVILFGCALSSRIKSMTGNSSLKTTKVNDEAVVYKDGASESYKYNMNDLEHTVTFNYVKNKDYLSVSVLFDDYEVSFSNGNLFNVSKYSEALGMNLENSEVIKDASGKEYLVLALSSKLGENVINILNEDGNEVYSVCGDAFVDSSSKNFKFTGESPKLDYNHSFYNLDNDVLTYCVIEEEGTKTSEYNFSIDETGEVKTELVKSYEGKKV